MSMKPRSTRLIGLTCLSVALMYLMFQSSMTSVPVVPEMDLDPFRTVNESIRHVYEPSKLYLHMYILGMEPIFSN